MSLVQRVRTWSMFNPCPTTFRLFRLVLQQAEDDPRTPSRDLKDLAVTLRARGLRQRQTLAPDVGLCCSADERPTASAGPARRVSSERTRIASMKSDEVDQGDRGASGRSLESVGNLKQS